MKHRPKSGRPKKARKVFKVKKTPGAPSDNFPEQIINSLPGVFYVLDQQGQFLLWNKKLSKVLERADEEMAATNATAVFPEEEQQFIAERIEKVFVDGTADAQASLLSKSGKRMPYYFTGSRINLRRQECLIGMGIDISDQQRVDQQLRDNERKLLEAQRVAHIGSWEYDLFTKEVVWSDEMYRIFGYARDMKPSFEAFLALIHPDDLDVFLKEHQKSMQNKTPIEIDHRIKRPDGQVRMLHSRGEFILDEKGNPFKFVGIGQDITEVKQAQETIQEQASLLDKTQDAILVRNLDDRILYWNKGAELLYGWTAQEAVGKSAEELLFKVIPQEFREAQKNILEHGQWTGQFQQVTREGREIVVESRWTLIRQDNGKPKSKLIINTDITEKKKLEAQFLRAQRLEAIGTLASGIAHDLNNVLGPILLASQVLTKRVSDEMSRSMITTIESSANRGAGMVKQVLTFAKGIGGERAVLQPRHLINEMANIAKQTFPKSITIQTDVARNLWTISGDATQLHQILLNLSVNARDAMPKGGSLTVSATNIVVGETDDVVRKGAKPRAYVQISVTDTGTGIPEDIIEKIFDPFFTTKEPGKGTGLGLATVLTIVRGHEGVVDVESKVGQGTSFRVYLPALASAEAKKAATRAPELPTGGGELILVVDDELAAREMTSAILQAYGYRVLVSSDGAEALGMYAENKHDINVVMTDMMMPILDGTGTIRALKKMNPEVRIIAVSGSETESERVHSMKQDVEAFLAKPYTAEKLLRAIHSVLHKS